VARRNYEAILDMSEGDRLTRDDIINTYNDMFPELKESNYERIKNSIVDFIKQCGYILNPMVQKSMIAWLRKQDCKHFGDEDMKEALRREYERGRADAFEEMYKKISRKENEPAIANIIALLHLEEGVDGYSDKERELRDIEILAKLKRELGK
jgi:hypothetical protein